MRDTKNIKTILIKVGSSSLCNEFGQIEKEKILKLVLQISKLKKNGYLVALVSSGEWVFYIWIKNQQLFLKNKL